MKLYHGSKDAHLQVIEKRQAEAGEDVEVPADELLEAIYLTPDYGYALAMAARPDGLTNINTTDKTISFKNPEAFDPETEVYVYQVDVPEDETREIDELQTVIEGKDGIAPVEMFSHRAGDVEQYYEIITKTKEGENTQPEFKIR
jgi:hypothetical protein